jgi:UDP-N-acetyl-D-mannosaminuronic acid dehydrogenase
VKFNRICVVGLGYIGLPTASTFAACGQSVVGVDVNPAVLDSLRQGLVHIQEPGLQELVSAALATGRLKVSEKPVEADAYIIAVPTPFFEDRLGEFEGKRYKLADMRAVRSATEAVLPVLRRGNLVVLESTSPPRTTIDLVAPILEKSGLKAGRDFLLAYSPERVLPGQILRELVENARVIGGINPESAQAGKELYSLFVRGQIITSDATTAEMVKLMENTYRDVNIAIANEFSRLAERFGVDIWEAISIANLHPRVKILNPGPGVGGHCISVDPWFWVESAPDLASLIFTARRVNDSQPAFTLELVRRALGTLRGKRIAALGLAFKADVDDLRESPAAEVVRLLLKEGAEVRAYEPYRPQGLPGIPGMPSLETAVADADCILLLVNHAQFASLNPAELAKRTRARIAVDTRNVWKGAEWQAAGFTLVRLGVGKE